MQSAVLAEEAHFVNALAPVDIDGGATSDAWKMTRHSHATILIQLGVTGAASTVTVEKCTAADGTGATAIAFAVYKEETAAGDTLGARVSASASGFSTSTNDGVFYVIEIDAAELGESYEWLRVAFSDPGAATFGSCAVILSGTRYAKEESVTAIA